VPLQTLLAQKFVCIVKRPRTMGRDFYDASYLMARTAPDWSYLQQHLGTGDIESLRDTVLSTCSSLDLAAMARDIDPFVASRADAQRVELFAEQLKQWIPPALTPRTA
jgi:hypothetical protein